jgi:virulence-associated protein VapD
MEEKIEYPDFNKMNYSEIIDWIDKETKRRLKLGLVINDEEIRNLKLTLLLEKMTNTLEKYNERIDDIEKRIVKIEEVAVNITDIIKQMSEHLAKKKS